MVNDQLQHLRELYPWEEPKTGTLGVSGWLTPYTAQALKDTIQDAKLIVELGTFLGLSATYMHNNSTADIICIDTWLGSEVMKSQDGVKDILKSLWDSVRVNLYPMRDRITLMRHDSLVGLQVLYDQGLFPDVFYVDSDHVYDRVWKELEFITTNFSDATIVIDDYYLTDVAGAVHAHMSKYNRPAIVHPSFAVLNWKN